MTTMTIARPGAINELKSELDRTRAGRRWERLFHRHEREVETLAVIHTDVRSHLYDAAERLAEATRTREMDAATVRTANRVLDDLDRLGSTELRQTIATLREDLAIARSCSVDELLGD